MRDEDWRAQTQPRYMFDYMHGHASERVGLLAAHNIVAYCAPKAESIEMVLGVVRTMLYATPLTVDEWTQLSAWTWRVSMTDVATSRFLMRLRTWRHDTWHNVNQLHEAAVRYRRHSKLGMREARAWTCRMLLDLVPHMPLYVGPQLWISDRARAVALKTAITKDPVGHLMLADCLEDEGYSDYTLLDHLRSPGPHFHGCWAVENVLSLPSSVGLRE